MCCDDIRLPAASWRHPPRPRLCRWIGPSKTRKGCDHPCPSKLSCVGPAGTREAKEHTSPMEKGAGHWRRRASEVRAKQSAHKHRPPADDPAHRPAPVGGDYPCVTRYGIKAATTPLLVPTGTCWNLQGCTAALHCYGSDCSPTDTDPTADRPPPTAVISHVDGYQLCPLRPQATCCEGIPLSGQTRPLRTTLSCITEP